MDKKSRKSSGTTPRKEEEMIQTLDKFSIKTIKEMMKDRSLSKHQQVLEEIYKFIMQAMDNDKKWSSKCQVLRNEIASNALKVKTAVRLSEEDKSTIQMLKEELEKAWELIEELRASKGNLQTGNEEGICNPESGDSNEAATMKELLAQNQSLCSELEKCREDLTSFKNLKAQWSLEKQQIETKRVEELSSFKDLKAQWNLEKQQIETERDANLKYLSQYKMDLKNLNKEKGELRKIIDGLKGVVKEKDELVKGLELKLKTAEEHPKLKKLKKTEQEKLLSEIENQKLEISQLQGKLLEKDTLIAELNKERDCKLFLLVQAETELSEARKQLEETLSNLNMVDKCIATEPDKNIQEHELLKKKLKEMKLKEKRKKVMRKDLVKDNRMLTKRLSEAGNSVECMKIQLTKTANANAALKSKCLKFEEEIKKQAMIIEQVEKIRNIHVNEIGNLEMKVNKLENDLFVHERENRVERIESLEQELNWTKENLESAKVSCAKYEDLWGIAVGELNTVKETVRSNVDEIRSLVQEVISKNDDIRLHNICDVAFKITSEYSEDIGKPNVQEHANAVTLLKSKIGDTYMLLKSVIQEKHRLISELDTVKINERVMSEKIEIQEKALIQFDKDYREQENDFNTLKSHIKKKLEAESDSSAEKFPSVVRISESLMSSQGEDEIEQLDRSSSKSFGDCSNLGYSVGKESRQSLVEQCYDQMSNLDQPEGERTYLENYTLDELRSCVDETNSNHADDYRIQNTNTFLDTLDSEELEMPKEASEEGLENLVKFHFKSDISKIGKGSLLQRIAMLENMLKRRTEEVIMKNVDVNKKAKTIEKLKKSISGMERESVSAKHKKELEKKEKAIKDMEQRVKSYESCIRNHQMEEIRLNSELQRLRASGAKLVLSGRKSQVASSKQMKFVMNS